MASQSNPKTTNFWFGFSLGILSTSAFIYFFGTEKGRKALKKLIDLTENFEENLSLIAEELDHIGLNDNKESTKKMASTIGSILNKVKSFTP